MATFAKSSASTVFNSVVALTYDDGPSSQFTHAILDILDAHQARATFFCVGQQLERHGELAARAFRAGHEIGNHSYSHRDLADADRGTVLKEIEKTDALIFSITGNRRPLVRPPFGKTGPAFEAWLKETGRSSIGFDVAPDPPDYLGADPILIAEYVREKVRPGSIVVLHDGGKENHGDRTSTVEATRFLIPILKLKGYRFVTVSELMAVPSSKRYNQPKVTAKQI